MIYALQVFSLKNAKNLYVCIGTCGYKKKVLSIGSYIEKIITKTRGSKKRFLPGEKQQKSNLYV